MTTSNLRLKVRETLKIFFPLAVLLSLGVFVFLKIDKTTRMDAVETGESFLVNMAVANMNNDLDVLTSDISILKRSNAMKAVNEENTAYSQAILAENFVNFARYRQIYDQIRLIDKSGMELIRVNYKDGKAVIVPEREFQDKSKRYYFSKILALERDENFISSMDLNVENGKIEKPFKPIIRIGTPIFDKMGDRQGVLVLNYLGRRLIKIFDQAMAFSIGQAHLINRDGYWLRSPERKDEWGGILGSNRSFKGDHPKVWAYMEKNRLGKIYGDNGLFVFDTFSLTNKGKGSPSFRIVTYVPSVLFSFSSLKRFWPSMAFFSGILVFLAIGSWIIGAARISRNISGEALRRSEHRFSTAFNYSPCMIAITDINDGRLLDVNEIWLSTLGYSRSQVIGKTVFELNLWVVHGKRIELVDRVNKEGHVRDFEGCLKTRDGKVRDFVFSGEKIELDEGPVLLLAMTDITERKQVEVALRSARDSADLSNRAKTEFLANMSHELRTPLNAIIGFSEIMSAGTFGSKGLDKYREYATDIKVAGGHLLKLINDILDVSRIESDGLPLLEDMVDVKQIIISCQRLVQGRAEKAGLELKVEIPDILPAMMADERRIKQILINILSNAVKFTQPGGTVTIRVIVDDDGGYLISVIDTGVGIKPEDMETVLSTFGQADGSLSRRHEGAGLGLPLSKSLVELHGGKLIMESTIGVGTAVSISLPRERTLLNEREQTEGGGI